MLLVTDSRFAMPYMLDKHLQTVHILTPILMPSRPARLGNAIQSAKLLREPGTQQICHTDKPGGFQLVYNSAVIVELSQTPTELDNQCNPTGILV
jgi:hypothetical protein